VSYKKFDPQEFVKDLVEIANRDGIVSDDEKNLISSIENEIKKYSEELEKSMEDGILDRNEKLRLMNQRLTLVRKVFDTVQADMKITMDEQDIMDEAMKRLSELSGMEEEASEEN
jgi:uncharacterized tellurite resistance protein B-like protein